MAESEKNRRRRERLHDKQKGRCFYCPSDIGIYVEDKGSPILEHYTPRAHGGRTLVLACKPCDRAKGMIYGEEFEQIMRVAIAEHGEGLTTRVRQIIAARCKIRNTEIQKKHLPRQRGEDVTRARQARIEKRLGVIFSEYRGDAARNKYIEDWYRELGVLTPRSPDV